MGVREEFEKLPEIKRKLGLLIRFDEESEQYIYTGVLIDEFYQCKLMFVNGAWYAFQQQQKKIDSMLDHVCGKHEDFK